MCGFLVCLAPAALSLDLAGCNDGSTGCCMICPECACGNSCSSCSTKCAQPKGCACGSNTALRESALVDVSVGPMSVEPDAAAHE
jgi:hypothetical protein